MLSFDTYVRFHMCKDYLCVPAFEYLQNWRGEIDLDFIGRFEHLLRDFAVICDKLSIPNTGLPHELKSDGKKNLRDFYDDELISLVKSHFQWDIDTFEYSPPN